MATKRKLRWWPAWGILSLAAALQIWAWGFGTGIRQGRVITSLGFLVLTVLALLLWFFFLSRIRWRHRLSGLGLMVVLGVVAFSLVRVHGVSGDLVPILAWRWNSGLDEAPVPGDNRGPQALVTDRPFPQFLGLHRNATIPEVTLQPDWTSTPPREVWRRSVGEGWSGFAVVEELAITLEQRGESEFVVAYDLGSGKVRWAHEDRGSLLKRSRRNGPPLDTHHRRGSCFRHWGDRDPECSGSTNRGPQVEEGCHPGEWKR